MNLVAVPRRNRDITARSIDDAFFLVNPETSELHSMNAVGQRIWELIDGERTVGEVSDLIAEEYDVDREAAEQDALEFLSELQEKSLVVVD